MSPFPDPVKIAEKYIGEVRKELSRIKVSLNVVGFVASDDIPSMSYARATRQKFEELGITYNLRKIARLDLEEAILEANDNPLIHGLFVYLPVFNNEQDVILRNLVDYRKDIEGGCQYWTRKLYSNDRVASHDDPSKKAILPCTPLAIIKMLTEAGAYLHDVDLPIAGKKVAIFNRSEVVGRPLAAMMSNDGAEVFSFDINGPLFFNRGRPSEIDISRKQALTLADIVITGVPNKSFRQITAKEIKPGATCLNFSYYNNFSEDIGDSASLFIPRVGPVTVAMSIRNTLRLYKNFYSDD
jgi:methylenetetrahydrofolate dehydrogenase (NADP+)/methenyltetrahydrofolate cyclohydrolase